jgi:UDP-N-acetylmuramoylalanine--D-glutamate ligase
MQAFANIPAGKVPDTHNSLKKLVILGAGESGVGAALLAKQKGYDVFVSDGGSIKEVYKNALQQSSIVFE